MESMTSFLAKRIRLTVHRQKSAVDRPWRRQFLGYSGTTGKQAPPRVAPDREKRLKLMAREILRPGRGRKVAQTLKLLVPKIRGWASLEWTLLSDGWSLSLSRVPP